MRDLLENKYRYMSLSMGRGAKVQKSQEAGKTIENLNMNPLSTTLYKNFQLSSPSHKKNKSMTQKAAR